jgi:hypothetical protein
MPNHPRDGLRTANIHIQTAIQTGTLTNMPSCTASERGIGNATTGNTAHNAATA